MLKLKAMNDTAKTIKEVNLTPNSPPPKLKLLTNTEKRNHTPPRDVPVANFAPFPHW